MNEQSFRALGVGPQVERVLAERGIVQPFPIQELVLPDALAGRDVLAKSPTGSGKTLAFAIPIVTRVGCERTQPAALVLVPTRELAGQVSDEIRPLAEVSGCESRRGLRRGAATRAGEEGEWRADPGRHARAPAGSGREKAGLARAGRSYSCSTRPTACSTWASSRRSSAC